MVFRSLFGWSKATELNDSATSDTVLRDEDEEDVVDVLSVHPVREWLDLMFGSIEGTGDKYTMKTLGVVQNKPR